MIAHIVMILDETRPWWWGMMLRLLLRVLLCRSLRLSLSLILTLRLLGKLPTSLLPCRRGLVKYCRGE